MKDTWQDKIYLTVTFKINQMNMLTFPDKNSEILKYIESIIRVFLFPLFTVPHLNLIQGKSTERGTSGDLEIYN